jgi:hypothetical protein
MESLLRHRSSTGRFGAIAPDSAVSGATGIYPDLLIRLYRTVEFG